MSKLNEIFIRIANTSYLYMIMLLAAPWSSSAAQEYEDGRQLEYKTRAIGNSWIGPVGKHMQNHITDIEVFDDGTVRTRSPWDEGGNRYAEYKDGQFVRRLSSSTANSKVAVDLDGNTWTIENYYGRFLDISANHGGSAATDRWRIDPIPEGDDAPYIKSSDGREIRLIADPSAIGINKVTGELLVADNTEAQNIKIFDISGQGEPVLKGTFGVEGGIYAGPNPGAKDDPLKFNGITGVGTDVEGNIYVSLDGFPGSQSEGGGADLRAFSPDGTLRWRMVGLMFVRAASVDPLSGGTDIYCPFTLYRVDYSKEPDHNMNDWTDVALTIDPFKYPDDPRLVGAVNTALAIVNVNGNKYMFSTDMYNEPLFVHRFDGHIAVPVAVITAGYGWNGDEVIKFRWKHNRGRPATPRWMWVDRNGDGLAQEEEFELFELGAPAERNFVRGISIDREGGILLSGDHGYWYLPVNYFDQHGNPQYSAESIRRIEGTGYNPRAMKWLDDIDVMVTGEGNHSHMSNIHVYDNWSDPGNRSRRYTITPPLPSTHHDPVGGAFNLTADNGYLYISYSVEAGPNTAYRGEVLVYRLSDGGYMGYITPGPEVGEYSGWIDMRQATYAYARPNGERIITVEEDGVGKVLIYEWCPPGEECMFECATEVDSVVVSPSEIVLDGLQTGTLQAMVYPDTVCFDKVFWYSLNDSIVSTDNKGVITSTGVGSTWIRVVSEQQPGVSDSSLVTVNYVAVTGIIFARDSMVLQIGESVFPEVNFVPDNAINRKLRWESSDGAVVSVDQNGKVTGLTEGTAILTATSEDGGYSDSCLVEVIAVPVNGIEFDPGYAGIWVGDSLRPGFEIFPGNAGNKEVLFEITDTSVAQVDSTGMVWGLSPGRTNLIVTTVDGGFIDSCVIHVPEENEYANLDIGNPCGKGSMKVSSDLIYTVKGSGTDIWHSSDEFHFAYRKQTGNTVMIARVKSMTNTDGWAKSGVMIRESLKSGSRHAMMVITPSNGFSFQRRTGTDGPSDHTTPGGGHTAPAWVKIIREGNIFSGYRSVDGKSWVLVGSEQIEMAEEIHAGLAVTSHSGDCRLNTSVFDYVVLSDNIDTVLHLPSSDATLSDLTVDGTTIDGFDPDELYYEVTVTDEVSVIPVVGATATHENAYVEIFQPDSLPGTATVHVIAEDGEKELTYTINFSLITHTGIIKSNTVVLYPNPAGDYVILLISSGNEREASINIYDISGALQYSMQSVLLPGDNSIHLDLSSLDQGLYLLEAGDKIKSTMKLLIQR